MQGSDRVHCLTRWRLAAPSGNGGGSLAGQRAMEQRCRQSSADLHSLHFERLRQRFSQSRNRLEVAASSKAAIYFIIDSKDRRGAKCSEAM